MTARPFDAVLLDLDGTVVDDRGRISSRTKSSLHRAREHGVAVMLATGRSEGATVPVLEELELQTPAVVYNGAGVFCPWKRRMVEMQLLAEEVVREALRWSRATGHLVVSAGAKGRYATPPRTEEEAQALRYYSGLEIVEHGALPTENVIRMTVFSSEHRASEELGQELETTIGRPVYVTHFPLNALSNHRNSVLSVADVQPPCRGKAEGVRLLRERYGITAERVVAVGDAFNDVPMFEAAGLGVAMGNAMPAARAAADRVIGDNNSDALADLLDELFGA